MKTARILALALAGVLFCAACSGGDSVENGSNDNGGVQSGAPISGAFHDAQPMPPDGGAQPDGTEQSRNAQAGEFQRNSPARGLPEGAIRVKRAEVIDRSGFEKPLTAMTILIPADWRSEGGVVWGAKSACSAGSGYTVNFNATSPDGQSGVHFLPSFNWVWNNFSGGDPSGACPFLQMTSAQQYLEYLVSQMRPGARVLDFRARPDIAKDFEQLNSVSPMPMGEMRSWVDSGEVLIGYTENGAELRETIAAVVIFNRTLMRGSMGMADSDIITAAALPGFAMRAPNGKLDFNFTETIRRSARPGREWAARIAQHNAKISQINLKGARDRSRIAAQTSEEIRQMQQDTWRMQNESSDRMSRETSEAIRGVETYNDPYHGGTVELDHTYENAWQLNDGSYVLTNDAMFQPFRDLGVDGQKLQPVE